MDSLDLCFPLRVIRLQVHGCTFVPLGEEERS